MPTIPLITKLMQTLMDKYGITSGAAANMECEINASLEQCVDLESMESVMREDYDLNFHDFYTFEGENELNNGQTDDDITADSQL
jgi:hypothetical protein